MLTGAARPRRAPRVPLGIVAAGAPRGWSLQVTVRVAAAAGHLEWGFGVLILVVLI